MTTKQFRPNFAPARTAEDPAWQTVDWSLDRGQVVTTIDGKIDAPFPVPTGCINQWRAFRTTNDYGETMLVYQARRAAS